MNTKTNTKIMTAKQARETTRCSGKTLEFLERLRKSVLEEIEVKTSNGYLSGELVIWPKFFKVNYVAAVEDIVKELKKLGYDAAWKYKNFTDKETNKTISITFSWGE